MVKIDVFDDIEVIRQISEDVIYVQKKQKGVFVFCYTPIRAEKIPPKDLLIDKQQKEIERLIDSLAVLSSCCLANIEKSKERLGEHEPNQN